MTKITKAIGTAVAAAAIGGGALIVSELSDETANTENGVDDVVAATVETPQVSVPKVELPKVTTPSVVTPAVTGMTVLSAAPAIYSLPETDLSASVETTGVRAATAQTANARTVSAQTADARTATAQTVTAQSADARTESARTEQVEVPLIASGAARIPQYQAMLREAQTVLADQRSLQHDSTFGLDSTAWKKWLAIYRKNEPYQLEYKPLPADLRIIAEVKYPADADQVSTLDRNLDFYGKQGYNAVLLTFDTTEDIGRLLDTASLIRAHGLKIVCAYSGPENLRWSVFRDPNVIADYVSRVCAVSDVYLIGWRRTSCHLLIQDDAFRNHLLRSARKFNPNIAVLGEAYYGQTAHSNLRTHYVSYNVPENASGVLLFGIGYKGVALEIAMTGMFPAVKDMPRIGLAIGEKPYFDTHNDTGKTFAQNLAVKQRIERRFRAGGCVGTMTIRGDGSDGIYDKRFTENLAVKYGKEETMP